jgi:hypothetical protein
MKIPTLWRAPSLFVCANHFLARTDWADFGASSEGLEATNGVAALPDGHANADHVNDEPESKPKHNDEGNVDGFVTSTRWLLRPSSSLWFNYMADRRYPSDVGEESDGD